MNRLTYLLHPFPPVKESFSSKTSKCLTLIAVKTAVTVSAHALGECRVQCFPKANNWDNTTPGRPGLSHTNLLSSRGSPRDWSIHGGGAFHETNLTKMHVMKQHCYRNNGSWIMRWSDAEQFPSHTTLEHLQCQISTLCSVAISSPFAPCRLASRATFQGTHGSGKTQVERHLRIVFWHTKVIIALECS